MRQSQKLELKEDHWKNKLMERSAVSGDGTFKSGIDFKALVFTKKNLNDAYSQVKKNNGAAGIDGMTVDELSAYLQENKSQLLPAIRNLSYKPKPVRRVEIPKPDGSMRKLGIPTVVDRWLQQAIAQAMTPIFERVFSDNSFGFRPGRDCKGAIERVINYYDQGYQVVIDLDLKAFFDTVDHDLLIKFVKQYIDDEWLLKMIRKFLKSGVMNHSVYEDSFEGTPQGGGLSPLLANIYLNELDKVLESRGHKFVRYADDCNIYVKSERAGYRVLESITKFLEKDLKLTINQKKTAVGSPKRLKFLGYSLYVSGNHAYVRPSEETKKRVKKSLKLMTKRNRGISLEKMLGEIKSKMGGWFQYYGICKMASFIRSLDRWLRSRIRQYIWKQWKNTKTRVKNLVKLGIPSDRAWIFANTRKGYWRMAHSKLLFYTLTNKKLESLGLINLSKRYQHFQNA